MRDGTSDEVPKGSSGVRSLVKSMSESYHKFVSGLLSN